MHVVYMGQEQFLSIELMDKSRVASHLSNTNMTNQDDWSTNFHSQQ